jgi:undecaprenyl-diphosphatase
MIDSEYIEALILGVVQGIAEFLPISSSGHLVIFSELLHQVTGREVDPHSSLHMNVALHFGTLLSILVVYRKDLIRLIDNRRLCVWIVLATVPVVIVGFGFKDLIEQNMQSPLSAGCFLLVTAALLLVAHKSRKADIPLEKLSWSQALTIGIFQAVAIIPGISRSGSTIAGGLVVGMRHDAATTFSFFIAIPAILGAVFLTLLDIAAGNEGVHSPPVLLLGAAVSFVVGFFSLRWLIRLVSQQKLHWFAWYCAVAGLVTILWQCIERWTA